MLRIREVAKMRGYTITSLAEKIGMSQVSLSRIINGNPTAETLNKISEALNVDIRELFTPTGEAENETLYVKRSNNFIPIGSIKKDLIK